MNQFISSAVAEKMSSLLTEEYLLERSQKGNHSAFLKAMSKVPDVEPEVYDKLKISRGQIQAGLIFK